MAIAISCRRNELFSLRAIAFAFACLLFIELSCAR